MGRTQRSFSGCIRCRTHSSTETVVCWQKRRLRRMKDYIQAHVQRSETGYQAECFDLPILTHGDSLNEAVENLQAAIYEFLEGKDLTQMGLAPEPKVMVSFHFGPYAFADM